MSDAAVHQFDLFATLVAHRVFVSAWDAHARRRLPSGLTEIVLNTSSGQGAPYRYIARSSWEPGRFEQAHPNGRMPEDRTRGDIRTTRAGGYRAQADVAVVDAGRDEATIFLLLAAGADLSALDRVTMPIRHRQIFSAVTPDQGVATIVECFVAQTHAHRLRREFLANYPDAGVGVYQQDMVLGMADVRRSEAQASKALFA
jgi:hypothetical protein